METNSQNIELINDYLNHLLSKEAQIEVENRLQNDMAFNAIYQEHLVFLNGINRIQIKEDILKAKRSYYTEKWLKISGVAIVVSGILVLLYTLIFNASEVESTSTTDHSNTITTNTSSDEKSTSNIVLDSSEVKTQEHSSETEEGLLLSTVNETHKPKEVASIALKKNPQYITLNTQNDTVITCKEGTILKITKGSFINPKTGKKVLGSIALEVTEYYKLSDMLLANLSTVSNGKQLETGGMLYIEAKQKGTVLELNQNSSIEISFPTNHKKPNMQLFSGHWKDDTINWTLQTTNTSESIEVIEEHVEVPFSVVEQVPTFPGCENEDDAIRKRCTQDAISNFITKNFNIDIAYNLGLRGTQRIMSVFKIDRDGQVIFIQSRATDPRLSDEADRVIGLLPKMVPGMQRGKPVVVPYSLPIIFEVNEDMIQKRLGSTTLTGEMTSLDMDTIFNDRRGMVEYIREVMHDKDFLVDSLFIMEWDRYKKQKLIRSTSLQTQPNSIENAVILRKALFEMEDSKFKILDDDSITRGGHVIRIPWDETRIPTTTRVMNIIPKRKFYAGNEAVTAETFESRLADSTERSITSRDVSYYVLKTSTLGWINCDRFINGRTKRIKYKLKIKNAEGAQVSMVFKSVNAVLPSWYTDEGYDFQSVADNEDVILVAIKRKDGKLYYDLVDTKTKANPKVNFEFKEVSIEVLKKELEKLNNNSN